MVMAANSNDAPIVDMTLNFVIAWRADVSGHDLQTPIRSSAESAQDPNTNH
jgi:hypothetical protein